MVVTPDRNPSKEFLWFYVLALWLALVAFLIVRLELFAATPGTPSSTESATAGSRHHLYVFLSPTCPCSRATINELNRILVRSISPVDVTAVLDMVGQPPEAAKSLLSLLYQNPRIAVKQDPEAQTTREFGARTSGQVLLYTQVGNLIFSGGITPARGHEGDNDGADAVASVLRRHQPKLHRTPIYGCALLLGTEAK